MSNVKILHCADIHIGALESFLGTKAKQRQTEALLTFKRAVNIAVSEGVQLFLIAGDLFDSLKIEHSYFYEVLDTISSAQDIKFVYSCGNHDPYNANSPLKNMKTPSNLYIFDTKDSVYTFKDIEVNVYGRSFADAFDNGEDEFSVKPLDNEYLNIMCIHGDLVAGKNSDYNPISPSFIDKSGMDYIALGHVHKFSDIGKIGKTEFAYCGCIEGQGFDELGEKGVIIGNVSKQKNDLSFRAISSRMHITENVDVDDSKNCDETAKIICDKLHGLYGSDYAENLYKIILTGSVPDTGINISDLTARLNENIYYVKLRDKTALKEDLELLSAEPSLKGIFVKKMLERINSSRQEDKQLLYDALKIGLKAFSSEVIFDED